ncbi:major facilitator superfamily domain-containing protein [Xylariomycetidae sp. FL2044]|nr:major facilitator superfamily domain-containing protein [Xylariomycetidae sp. FL2044]
MTSTTRLAESDGGQELRTDSLKGIRLQLTILGTLRSTEAIAWTSIFPYVYFMLREFDEVAESQVPFFAGLLIAVFTFCEFLSGMIWASVSDRIGRKPTLLIGSLCGIVAAMSFGFSRSVAVAVSARAFGGLFNPNVGLVQTCVVELAREKEQRAKALSYVTFLRSMGNLVGPVLGGLLANPAELYPSIFPPNSFWTAYRFALPNIVVASLQLLTSVAMFLYLEETNPRVSARPDVGLRIGAGIKTFLGRAPTPKQAYTYVPLSDQAAIDTSQLTDASSEVESHEPHPGPDPSPPPVEENFNNKPPASAFTPQVIFQILAVSILAFHKVSSDAIMPTFLAAPFPDTGGFGYSSQKIGIILLSQAVFAMIIQAAVIPRLIGRLGALRAFRLVLGLYPCTYVLTPFLPRLAGPLGLGLVVLDLWIKVMLSSVGYICSAVLISDTAPARDFLARINGAAASLSCLSRSIGPIVSGKLLEVAFHRGFAGVAFWTLGGVALMGGVESLLLKDHI